jgi:outer membrane protein assembly factor BamB
LQAAASSAAWPSWRGGLKNLYLADTQLPLSFSNDTAPARWRTRTVGEGASSPVIADGRVYYTSSRFEYQTRPLGNAIGTILCVLGLASLLFDKYRVESIARPAGLLHVPFLALATLFLLSDPSLIYKNVAMVVVVLAACAIAQATLLAHSCKHAPKLDRLFITLLVVDELVASGMFAAVPARYSLLLLIVAWETVSVVAIRRSTPSTQPPVSWRDVCDDLHFAGCVVSLLVCFVAFASPESMWLKSTDQQRWLRGVAPLLLSIAYVSRCLFVAKGAARRVLLASLILAPVPLVCLMPKAWGWEVSAAGRICLVVVWPLTALGILTFPPNGAKRSRLGWSDAGTGLAVVMPAVCLVALGLASPQALSYHVVCLSLADGGVLWDTVLQTSRTRSTGGVGSDAAPTPLIAGDTLIAHFSDQTVALDMRGGVVWRRTQPTTGESYYGAGSSPVLYKTSVIVTENTEYFSSDGAAMSPERLAATAPAVVGLSLTTGHVLWRSPLPRGHGSYSTPAIAQVEGRDVLVLPGSRLFVLDPSTGTQFQSISIDAEEMTGSPAILGSLVLLGGGPNRGSPTTAYQLLATATGVEPRLLWRSSMRSTTIASPVVTGDESVLIDTDGSVLIMSTDSGRVTREMTLDGAVYASPIVAAGRLYVWTTRGTAYIIGLKPSLKILESTELAEDVFATPAIAGRSLILRTAAALYRFDPPLD